MKHFSRLWIVALLLFATSPWVLAQGADAYNNFSREAQTKNIPSGTVIEPGSQLFYILDTGINAEARFKNDPGFTSKSVTDLDPALTKPNFQNFISITNTNPTRSVTVHFRYFSSDCSDIIDFLMILTCNDTILVDPFNFTIPGTSVNVSQAFFGSASGTGLTAITASKFADGRFLLFVTASGDPEEADDIADHLFPRELVEAKWGTTKSNWFPDCTGDIKNDVAGHGNVGNVKGISDSNLHILNASAVAFDYLTGFHTVAIPTGLLTGQLPPGSNDLAYGVNAFTRPSVDLYDDENEGFYGDAAAGVLAADGDGPQAQSTVGLYAVLSGSEDIRVSSAAATPVIVNDLYLRNDVHGGDIWPLVAVGNFDLDSSTEIKGAVSLGGALAWTLFPIQGTVSGVLPSEQLVNFVSIIDDYNGSGNPSGAFADRSYGLDSADTIYKLTVFNNNEKPLTVPPDIISPPPPGKPLEVLIRCINAWTFTGSALTFDAGNVPIYDRPASGGYAAVTKLGDFSVADLFTLGGTEVQNFLAAPVAVSPAELGPGWVRFDRVVTGPLFGVAAGGSAWDGDYRPSYAVFGQSIVRFLGFGVSWFLPTSATNFQAP